MGNKQSQPDMFEVMFNLKTAKKQMEKMAAKSMAQSEKEKKLLKKHLEQGDKEIARIHAENSIRKKTESVNFLRMAGRMDATISRIQTAQQMNQVSHTMGHVVKGMDKVMASMDLEKISGVMDKFEEQFAEMDVRAGVMEGSMQTAMMTSAPEGEIDALLQEVGEEHGLDVAAKLTEPSKAVPSTPQKLNQRDEEDLSARLANLRAAELQ
eukprot:m.232087 g.232087  ORF g.232087 m.232087 type:complete len:210 (-) comp13901_c1_seq1:2332-2961(-)